MLLLLPSCRFIHVSDEVKQQIKSHGLDFNADKNGETVTASDVLITRNENPGDFSSLKCSLPCDMTYLPGDCAVSLYGPDNVIEHITLTLDEGLLNIKSDGTNFRKLKDLKITVSAPLINAMEFSGAIDFEAPQGIFANSFSVTLSGAGDIDIRGLKATDASITINGAADIEVYGLETESLSVDVNGAGDAKVEGRTGRADLKIKGAGDIDATNLQTEELNTRISGAGSVKRPARKN